MVVDVTNENVQKTIKDTDKPLIVDFWAECGSP